MGIIITLLLAFSSILDPNGTNVVNKQTDNTYSSVNSTSSILDPNGVNIGG